MLRSHDAFCRPCLAEDSIARAEQHCTHRIRLANVEEEAQPMPCPVCRASAVSTEDKAASAALQRRLDTLEATWQRRVDELRSLISQQHTPEKLESKLLSRGILPRLRVIPTVGDGPCLFYTLLHSLSALQPLPCEADELRIELRG